MTRARPSLSDFKVESGAVFKCKGRPRRGAGPGWAPCGWDWDGAPGTTPAAPERAGGSGAAGPRGPPRVHLLVLEAGGRGSLGRGRGATGQWGEGIQLLHFPWKVEGVWAMVKCGFRVMEGLGGGRSRPGTVLGAVRTEGREDTGRGGLHQQRQARPQPPFFSWVQRASGPLSPVPQRPLLDVGPHVWRAGAVTRRLRTCGPPSLGSSREGNEPTRLGSRSFGARGNYLFKNT